MGHFVVKYLNASKNKDLKWEMQLNETVAGERSDSRAQKSGQF
jgi:hypothetical protein